MEDVSTVHCPYCGEPIELFVDGSQGAQDYIEDCTVCCRPMRVALRVDDEGNASAHVAREDDA